VFETSALFEGADREFNDGVVAVELIRSDCVETDVRDEGVVTPVRKQLCLFARESGPAYDESNRSGLLAAAGGFGDLCSTVECVVDIGPVGLGDRGDRGDPCNRRS
jgi:hypothetical protein